MTIGDIIDELVKEVGGDATDDTLAANLLSFCTAALRRIPKRVRDRALVKIDSVSLSAAAQSVALPTDFIKERQVWRLESGSRMVIDKVVADRFNTDHFNSSGAAVPSQYRIYGSLIEFQAPADQTYTIYLEYFFALTTTAITTSTVLLFREDMFEPFKDLVKAYYYEYEDDDERASSRLKRAIAYFQEIDDEFVEEEMGQHIGDNS